MENAHTSRLHEKICLIVLILLGGVAMVMHGQICGDVDGNGVANIVDALKVAQAFVGFQQVSAAGDVDGNGVIDIVDALRIAQYYVGLISTLNCGATITPAPSECCASGAPIFTPSGPTPESGVHLDNPYQGANIYVDPDWSAKASAGGGAGIANQPTFIWLDKIAKIAGGSGSCTYTNLTQHLENALAQGRNAIQIVLSDIPNKNCAVSVSDGELIIAQNGISTYKTAFIDPIVAILKNYPNLRIICLVEPNVVPNLVTNLSFPRCAEAISSGSSVTCLQYAVNQLKGIGNNIYIYLDIANDAWLGWDPNFQPFVDKMTSIVSGTTLGKNSIDGFISNTGMMVPWEEPFIGPDGKATVNGGMIYQSRFLDFNPFTCERPYVEKMRAAFITAGFPSTIGMLLDTSRNGWGGPNRPTTKSASTDINTYVDESRIDRRYHRGNWCNQSSAGIGARPQVAPSPGMDAFVWVNSPGTSDGQSALGSDPCDPNKTLDQMCLPGGINTYCYCGTNGAMAGAPSQGAWFQAMFTNLLQNAYPPL